MKHLLITFITLLAMAPAHAKVANTAWIPASDSRITFIGRTLASGDSVKFDWTGVYARLKFSGSCLYLTASDTKKNYFNVWLDRAMDTEPDKIISIHSTDTTIVLFSKSEMYKRFGRKQAGGEHTVILQKRTEGEQGMTTFAGFSTDGAFYQAEGLRDRIIEYVGDSYTCGFGSENSVRTDPFLPETENQNKTYADIIARHFGADQIVIAHSGMGIARNYNDHLKGWYMPERYLQTFDADPETRWDAAASPLRPDITVVYLGTNDFSTSRQPVRKMFTANYITLLKAIKSNYGENHPVLCIAPKNDSGMYDYIREVQLTCGLKDIHVMVLSADVHDSESDLGASWHPNYTGHRKKAFAIIPYVSTITGWELTEAPLR